MRARRGGGGGAGGGEGGGRGKRGHSANTSAEAAGASDKRTHGCCGRILVWFLGLGFRRVKAKGEEERGEGVVKARRK